MNTYSQTPNQLKRYLLQRSRKNHQTDGGFSLIEVMVVVLMVGILSAIAAPAWNAFVTRQRVRTVNGQVFQALKTAQAEAKRTKQDVTVTFDYDPSANPPVDPPTYTINGNTQRLDLEGEIPENTIVLSPSPATITFDYLGTVPNTNFEVGVSSVRGTSKQCVKVVTLLGAMITSEGNDCP